MKKHFTLKLIFGFIGLMLTSISYPQQTGSFNATITFEGTPGWVLSYYVPPTYNASNKYKLIISLHGLGDTPENQRDVVAQYVEVPGTSLYKNSIIVCPYLAGPNTDLWYSSNGIVADTALITDCIINAMSTYHIDTDYVYLTGFSYGGRGALRYGLLNYWRFRGMELWTPAIQTVNEANNIDSTSALNNQAGELGGFTFEWGNGRYIPMYISVENTDQFFYTVPIGYDHLYNAGAIGSMQVMYGGTHGTPPDSMFFYGFRYVDSHATSYAMNDAGISLISSPSEQICGTSFTPVITFQNKGRNNLTSVTVNYSIDNGTVQSYNWTGNLISLGTGKITFPSQSVSVGAHTLKAYTSLPNGVADNVTSNDTMTESFNSINMGTTSLAEGFEENTFPPLGWTMASTDSSISWLKISNGNSGGWALWPAGQSGAYGKSASCIYFDNSDTVSVGKKCSIRTPICDFTNSSNPTLQYDYGYDPSDSLLTDTLTIYYSTDCGNSWTTLLKKGGLELGTVGGWSDSVFLILDTNQWKHQSISLNLPGIVGQSEVMFSFEDKSGYGSIFSNPYGIGNLLYLDNIDISAITGIANEVQPQDLLSVYPNPTNENVTIDLNLSNATNVSINLYNMQGELVYSEQKNQCQGNYKINLDLNSYAKGIYLLNVITDKGMQSKRIVVE